MTIIDGSKLRESLGNTAGKRWDSSILPECRNLWATTGAWSIWKRELNVWDNISSRGPEDTLNESKGATPVETSRGIFHEEQGSTLVVSPRDLLQVKSEVQYRLDYSDNWKCARVINKAGNRTTASWHFLNIKSDDRSKAHYVGVKNAELKPLNPGEDTDIELKKLSLEHPLEVHGLTCQNLIKHSEVEGFEYI